MTEEAFLALFDQYRPMVYALALSYTRSPQDAEDVCQTAFLKLLERPPAEGKEKPWLARVAVNECRRLLRSPWRRRTGPLEEAPETAAFDTPAQSELFAEVMALPSRYRAAIYLHYYEGYSVREIAGAMNAKPSTVQTWLMRARGQLKTNLKEAESP